MMLQNAIIVQKQIKSLLDIAKMKTKSKERLKAIQDINVISPNT
jgi:hypothetical protein